MDISLSPNIYINISELNELRWNIIQEADEILKSSYQRKLKKELPLVTYNKVTKTHLNTKYSLLLNTLDVNANYTELEYVDRIYIPIKYFSKNEYANVLNDITSNFDTYIYMPSIIKPNYRNVFTNNITYALENYRIKGFVISNIGTLKMLENYKQDYKFIGNYTLNVYNNMAINAYLKLGLNEITLSPELNKQDISEICETTLAKTELMVYGRLPVMTLGYCVLGKSNKCYPNCNSLCESKHQYYLKDRIGLYFPIFADNTQTINTIYNSKITSIDYSDLDVNSVRIDILEESFDEINEIIRKVKSKEKLEGKDYTNGNFMRNV